MKLGKGQCFFNGIEFGECELSIETDNPNKKEPTADIEFNSDSSFFKPISDYVKLENQNTKLERVFESLPDDKIEEKRVSFKEYFYPIKEHSLDNQSFKFPIINPGYIRVKKEYNLLKTKFGKECIKNATQNLSDSIDNYLLEMFKTESYPYIDKRKDVSKPVNVEIEFKIHDSATEELKKFSDRFKKTDYLKKCRDLKKGKKQKEIDFAERHKQWEGKFFSDNLLTDMQKTFENLNIAFKILSDNARKECKNMNLNLKDCLNIPMPKVDRNRRKINKKKGYKKRRI